MLSGKTKLFQELNTDISVAVLQSDMQAFTINIFIGIFPQYV